jgi:hypothetical protein
MFKKLGTLVALAILAVAIATGTVPMTSKIASMLEPVLPTSSPATETVAATEATVQEVSPIQTQAVDQEALNAEALKTLVDAYSRQEAKAINEYVGEAESVLGEPGECLEQADASVIAKQAKKTPVRAPKKGATVKTGAMVEIDHSTGGSNYGNAVELSKSADGYTLSNFYNMGDTVMLNLTIDAEAGTVSVPKQVAFKNSTYGEVSFVGTFVAEDGKRYLTTDPVSGTIDSDGNISLGPWTLVVTDSESKYYLRSFIITTGSEWKVPNAQAKGTNMKSGEVEDYAMYISQNGDNAISLYGFFTEVSVELNARLTSAKTIVMPSQLVYNNAYYGAFNIYGASWQYDSAAGSWKGSIDTSNPMVFTSTSDNTLKVAGWVISAVSAPTQYVGYAYRDFTITTESGAIAWPEAAKINFAGSGTASDPYLIKTANDMKTMSQLVSEGNSFAGQYLAMANDIDMSSVSSSNYVAVGESSAPFEGTFDGKGYTLKNLTVNGGAFACTGVFGYIGTKGTVKNLNINTLKAYSSGECLGGVTAYNYGTIENCHVTNSVLDNDGECGGGIAGISCGPIKNCSFQGNLTATGSGAGIAGQASCSIEDCYVKGIIKTDGYVSLCYDCAGIAGVLKKGSIKNCWTTGMINEQYGRSSAGGLVGRCILSTIENSFTSAAVYSTRTYTDSNGGGDNYTGGLVGYINESTMNNCYSSSTIVKSGTSEFCGGLVGYISVTYGITTGSTEGYQIHGNSKVTNCYYSGFINSSSSSSKKGMFGSTFYFDSWTGEDPDIYCFENCYYDKQVNVCGEDYYGRNTSFFTNGLPEGFSSDVWEAQAGFYPVLKNVGAGTQAQSLSKSTLNLKDGQTAKKVKVGFSVKAGDNVAWQIYGAENNETTALKQEGDNFTVKNVYADAQVQALSADGYAVKMYLLSVVPKVFDGEGTEESPYLIKSVADLQNLDAAVGTHGQSHTGDYFAMTNDIDCSESSTLFQGVGRGSSYSFGGTFDGKGYSIKNMIINNVDTDENGAVTLSTSTSYGGLFAITTSDATIKNVVIDKSCRFSFVNFSGPLVGVNYGLVENCKNYAAVKAVSSYIGGLVGYNYGGTISGCYNAGRISAGVSNIGGITSFNLTGGKISMCQNDGDVIGESNNPGNEKSTTNTFGGICSYNYGTVELSVNNGEVSGDNTIGGLVGRNAGGDVVGCLNNGLASATASTTYRGAIIGYQQSLGTVANNYYDSSININGASQNVDIDGVIGLSTAELVAGSCPSELKALGAEEVYDFATNSYPVLKKFANEESTKALRTMYIGFTKGQVRNNVTSDVELSPVSNAEWSLKTNKDFKIEGKKLVVTVPTDNSVVSDTLSVTLGNNAKTYVLTSVPVIFNGNGTAESPFLIETPADWNKLADFMEASKWEYNGQHFKVVNDLDFAGDSIRVIAVNGVNFQGEMDGAGHTIKNYVYSNANTVTTKLAGPNFYVGRYIGLFGTLGSFGVIKDLTINGNFSAVGYIGGLVGYSYGTISNVIHKGTISNTSGTSVGGIAFRVYQGGSITDCANEGNVTAKTTSAAGISVETQVGTTLTRCYNRGNVTSTTSMASGIAYKVAGGLIDCGNEKTINGTGTLSGIAYSMDSTAYAVRCYNIAKLGGSSISTVCGLFNTFTSRYNSKLPEQVPTGGYVEDCYNTGEIVAKDYGYGLANKVNAGWKVSNSYNSGNVTSAGLACGLFNAVTGGAASEPFMAIIDHCYNTGDVTGAKATVSGLAYQGQSYSKWLYCYNTGKVVNTLTTGLCTAGLISQLNGYMNHCFNAGDVESGCNATGGLVGYVSYGKADYPGRIYNSFNIGNVTCKGYTGTGTQGNAGGLAGYMATASANYWVEIDGCYNAGTVKSEKRVGGLVGGTGTSYHVVKNCYNSGKVISEKQSDGTYWQSGAVYTNLATHAISGDTVPMLRNMSNCYYDKTVYTGVDRYESPAKGLTTRELKSLNISDSFEASSFGGYPVIKGFDDNAANSAGAIMILVADESEQNHDNITSSVSLVAPEGTTWAVYESDGVTNSDKMTIDGKTAKPVAKGEVVLVATTKDNMSRQFILTLDASSDAVNSVNCDKEVESVIYVDVQGRIVSQPISGNVYIVRTNYTDGTSSVVKVLAR